MILSYKGLFIAFPTRLNIAFSFVETVLIMIYNVIIVLYKIIAL